jgi:hypothetical protein
MAPKNKKAEVTDQAPLSPTRYKAIAPATDQEGNPIFSGRTCGVKFEYGVAVFDDYSLKQSRNPTGRSAADIAKIMEDDFGYVVEVVG